MASTKQATAAIHTVSCAVILLFIAGLPATYIHSWKPKKKSAKVSAVKTGQRPARPHSSSLKAICIVHPAPSFLKSHKAFYLSLAVSSSVAQYQHISVQCHRDTVLEDQPYLFDFLYGRKTRSKVSLFLHS